MSETSTHDQRDDAAKRRGGWRRWLVRGSIVVGSILLLVIIVTQIVLWTDYPKRLVIGQVQRTLGLLVAADSLSTGWLGNTTLRDVTLTLPLADEAFVTVPSMRVSHTSLVMMLLTRKMDIGAIALDGPRLVVRQDEGGRWNLQEVAELLGRVGGGKSAADASTPRQRATELPELNISQATVRVIDRTGREAIVEPVSVQGKPVGAMAWEYQAWTGADADQGEFAIEGRLAPGDAWKHEVAIVVRNVGPWLSPWVKDWPEPARFTATWNGQLRGGAVDGRLEIEDAAFQKFTGKGTAKVRAGAGGVTIYPTQLIVQSASQTIPELALQHGTITIDDEGATVDRVQFSSAGGIGVLTGKYARTTNAGEIHAEWQNILLPGDIRQSGRLDATLTTAWPNRPIVNADLVSTGNAGGNTWDAQLKVHGEGSAWREMDWRIDAPQIIAHHGQRSYRLDNFSAVVGTHGDVISIDEIISPKEGMVRGGGEFHLRDRKWWFWLHGEEWIVPAPNDVTISLSIDAFGNREVATLRQFFLDGGDLELTAHGYYVYAWPEPIGLYVYANPMGLNDTGEETIPLEGRLWSETWLMGTTSPLNVAVNGWLFGEDLAYGRRRIGDVQVDLAGRIDTELLAVRTKQMEMFDGQWELGLRIPIGPTPLEVDLAVENLQLTEAAGFAPKLNPADFSGTAQGEATFVIRRPTLTAIEMTGHFSANDIRAREIFASTASGQMNMRNGVLTIHDFKMQQQDGEATSKLTIDLKTPRDLDLEVTGKNWPLELPRAESSLIASEFNTKIHVNLEDKSVSGPVNIKSRITYRGQSLGEIAAAAAIDDRVIELQHFRADAFGGHASGAGRLRIDDLTDSHLFMQWSDIDAAQLATIVPRLEGATGALAGVIQIRRARDRRAIEPIQIHAELWPANLRFRNLDIGDCVLTAYASSQRLVLQRSHIRLADGQAHVWARLSRQRGEQLATHVMADFADLNINQLLHAAAPEAESMPGRVSGSVTLLGDPRDKNNLYGQGSLQLRDSELANSDIIGGLYDAMRLNVGPQDPRGHGNLDLHLERSQLQITNMRYFNRGVEARLNLTIDEVWKAKEAPISGFAVGTVRPLANIPLPLISDADVILSVVQQSFTTVGVSNTVGDPDVSIKAFDDITQNLRELILGDVQN